jgi:dolichol-phosphate mannosyltransferase
MQNNLSVLLIAHNEEVNIGRMIEGMLASYDKEIFEIVVVDDASNDNTAAVVDSWASRNKKVRLIKRTSPCGVGRALKTGFEHIDPEASYVLSMDSDFVENIGQVQSLIKAVDEKTVDGVIGSRFIKGGRIVNYPFLKKIMNRFFHVVVWMLFSIKQRDLTNNFKLYKASIFKNIPWRSHDFAMNAETGLLPILAGYRIAEVPVWWVGRTSGMGRSKFSLFKSGLSYIRVIAYAWRFSRIRKSPTKPKSTP